VYLQEEKGCFPFSVIHFLCSSVTGPALFIYDIVSNRLHFVGESPCFFVVVVCASLAHDGKEEGKKTHGEQSR